MRSTWNIEILRKGENCYFGPSWFTFCKEAKLEVNDLVVFQTEVDTDEVLVCVYKEQELSRTRQASGTYYMIYL